LQDKEIYKIGLGGGCHWCTEAVFQSLRGVLTVAQGYIASNGIHASFSEAVIVHYDRSVIPLEVLIEIHLLTHKSTKMHSMRDTYRSAVYVYNEEDNAFAKAVLRTLQKSSEEKIITAVMPFKDFNPSREEITNYYKKNPNKPFCERYISPKLGELKNTFAHRMVDF
jgi:peptide-methionine (S)-S-oxide reductase